MYRTLAAVIDRLDSSAVCRAGVIRWGCPVLSFGDPMLAEIATIGLNPSNREFVDQSGCELEGTSRRFHTLNSLGLKSWSEIDARHLRLILASYSSYFLHNPYNNWFRKLEQIVSEAAYSYYAGPQRACHLDLVPYATSAKWTELDRRKRAALSSLAGDTLGLLLRESSLRTIVLNGRTVVDEFQEMTGVRLERLKMFGWSLPRSSRPDVDGFAYRGSLDEVSGFILKQRIQVLGFNHNLQSSFGVTAGVIGAIRSWIACEVRGECL